MLCYNLLQLLMPFVLNSLTYIKSWANIAKNVIMNQILHHAYHRSAWPVLLYIMDEIPSSRQQQKTELNDRLKKLNFQNSEIILVF